MVRNSAQAQALSQNSEMRILPDFSIRTLAGGIKEIRKEIAGEKILTPTSHSIHEANPTSVIKDFNSFQCIIFMRRNVYAILALQNVRLISENKQVEEDKDKASDNRNLSFKHSTCFL